MKNNLHKDLYCAKVPELLRDKSEAFQLAYLLTLAEAQGGGSPSNSGYLSKTFDNCYKEFEAKLKAEKKAKDDK